MNNSDRPILITGMMRSGTSMTAGILHLCGAWAGKSYVRTRQGAVRILENVGIRDGFTKPMLAELGCDPGEGKFVQRKVVEDVVAAGSIDTWKNNIMSPLAKQGYFAKPRQWFYKSTELSLVWPIWNAVFPRARWVLVRRDAEDLVRSCLRTGYMKPYSNRSGWLRWVAEHEECFEEMYNAGLDLREIWPQRMVDGDFTQMQMVVNWLGLEWEEQKAREFVDPRLWRRGRNWERNQNLDRR
jgi:hypothetical protein